MTTDSHEAARREDLALVRLSVRLSGRVSRLEGLLRLVLDAAARSEGETRLAGWLREQLEDTLKER